MFELMCASWCRTTALVYVDADDEMSNRDAASKWHAMWLATAWLLVGVVVYLSLARLDVDIPAEGGDKIAHVIAYAVLAFWFMQVYTGLASRVVVAAGLIALGVTLE